MKNLSPHTVGSSVTDSNSNPFAFMGMAMLAMLPKPPGDPIVTSTGLLESSTADVSTSFAFAPSRPNYLPYVVGAVAVGVLAYELTRPAPRGVSPVPEPASHACVGVGVLGLAWRRRKRP